MCISVCGDVKPVHEADQCCLVPDLSGGEGKLLDRFFTRGCGSDGDTASCKNEKGIRKEFLGSEQDNNKNGNGKSIRADTVCE